MDHAAGSHAAEERAGFDENGLGAMSRSSDGRHRAGRSAAADHHVGFPATGGRERQLNGLRLRRVDMNAAREQPRLLAKPNARRKRVGFLPFSFVRYCPHSRRDEVPKMRVL